MRRGRSADLILVDQDNSHPYGNRMLRTARFGRRYDSPDRSDWAMTLSVLFCAGFLSLGRSRLSRSLDRCRCWDMTLISRSVEVAPLVLDFVVLFLVEIVLVLRVVFFVVLIVVLIFEVLVRVVVLLVVLFHLLVFVGLLIGLVLGELLVKVLVELAVLVLAPSNVVKVVIKVLVVGIVDVVRLLGGVSRRDSRVLVRVGARGPGGLGGLVEKLDGVVMGEDLREKVARLDLGKIDEGEESGFLDDLDLELLPGELGRRSRLDDLAIALGLVEKDAAVLVRGGEVIAGDGDGRDGGLVRDARGEVRLLVGDGVRLCRDMDGVSRHIHRSLPGDDGEVARRREEEAAGETETGDRLGVTAEAVEMLETNDLRERRSRLAPRPQCPAPTPCEVVEVLELKTLALHLLGRRLERGQVLVSSHGSEHGDVARRAAAVDMAVRPRTRRDRVVFEDVKAELGPPDGALEPLRVE
mmetsp:Transcript_22111/g.69162  ORF Transcript_22111/g.69162 Transcript_22111/m.69162 type:complete len:468 (+) Transcript_22111:191-1594(+)